MARPLLLHGKLTMVFLITRRGLLPKLLLRHSGIRGCRLLPPWSMRLLQAREAVAERLLSSSSGWGTALLSSWLVLHLPRLCR